MHKLFTYGTLQDPAVQLGIIGREVDLSDDVLPDFRLGEVKINGKMYRTAVAAPGNSIHGKVMGLADDELSLIDEYETAAYERTSVTLASGTRSWVYAEPQTPSSPSAQH